MYAARRRQKSVQWKFQLDQLSIQHFISSEQFALSSASVTLSGEWAEYSVPLDKGTNESFVQIYAGKNG